MSPLSDALHNPSAVLANLYQKHKDQGIDAFPDIVTSHFTSLFSSEDAFRQIPVLDLNRPPESFAERSLVVFHAMVQDTSLSPELYLAIQGTDKYGGWGSNLLDHYESNNGVNYENLRECTTFWAVSIPSTSYWCYRETLDSSSPQYTSMQKHKFPIPDAPHIGVQLKIYNNELAKNIRTTDIMSFVGMLGTEPLHTNDDFQSPTTHVPTLHVLFSAPLPRTIVPRTFPETSILPSIQNLRQELIKWIADEGLGGDTLTAEWVLASTISHVRSRHPPVLPLSLTISSFPAPPTDNLKAEPVLYHVLSAIFPVVTLLPLTLETLNNTGFCPESKDEDLHAGWLQQPKGTIMMINEGAITEGGISSKGLTNIRATQQIMKEQELEYIFPFSSFRFETDVNFLITTEGKKSTFFKTDVTVPLRPILPTVDIAARFYKTAPEIALPPPQVLLDFRRLVGGAMVGNVTVGDTLGKYVEEDFVHERSSQSTEKIPENKPAFGPDDLIQRMLVARSIAMSLHQTEITTTDWEAAKLMTGNISARA